MKKLLLTGFEPFLDFKENPTEKIVSSLNGQEIGEYEVFARLLPVDFKQAGVELLSHYDEIKPDAVLSLGLAAGRNRITPERIAINCIGKTADNQGATYNDDPIAEDGADGLFSRLPIHRIVDRLNEEGYPAVISDTAGTYLCNFVMYTMLHKLRQTGEQIPAGFVHVPASHELAMENHRLPSWSQSDIQNSVITIIGCL